MFEWTLDYWDGTSALYADPCVDCADLMAAANRAIHGGHFLVYPATYLLPPTRSYGPPVRPCRHRHSLR